MTDTISLRPARPGEGPALSALALRSKAHWGYPEDFLEAVRDELTLTEADLGEVTVAEREGEVAGFASLTVAGDRAELGHLFVDEPWIGYGVGGALLRHVRAAARARGVRVIEIDADPAAEPFYVHHGARTVGRVPSGSIPGRTLPHLEIAP